MTKILIIEDEAQTRNVFLRCLEIEGFDTCAASNALDGLELALREQPDLIVCDILMPDQTGYFVLSKLRRSPQTAAIPFIFLTAKVTMSELRQGMQLGADDYLTKPCTVEQFLEAIAVRLQRHQDVIISQSNQNPSTGIASQPVTNRFDESESLDFCFPHNETLNPIFRFIETHYNQSVKLDEIAREVGYSPAYLTNLVQKETGRTIKQWIIARRMMQARKLLKNTTQTVREIANHCGYPDAGYFTSQFRKFHDETPLKWRKTATIATK
ncbi:response regulator [[Limnothrix rosea] IAM M-220]|uniref:response regulator transcription factor n=1 Tax=[Limnothrix rosea] IAM M-220 TaxID=454133 RepID=UPI000959033D|nr:response regulator [[Limnothrix rosea] IAM M-220]OKH17015.1 DNA-binding response regulator [[Limnothrix rosea] IAM M-220]